MLTNKEKLLLISLLLQYPDEETLNKLSEIIRSIREKGRGDPIMDLAMRFLSEDPIMLQEEYVQNFDLNQKFSLYLTAWELRDRRERGMRILELKKKIQEAGFKLPDKELPDYVPLLLEFMATVKEEKWPENLKERISAFSLDAKKKIASDKYRAVFSELVKMFSEVKQKDQRNLESDTFFEPYSLNYEVEGEEL
ncbi:nitrate reductase molybdenum cofactor assembly chaperone [Saccharolobus shibatae]|uniref:Nitrate reductase molybdenum cofactor assembly chaperone n=1 Tax=Saccharolobus shibatae TaxID=2286 RepID=A0A8F5GWJ1_9CREN|nr:nitrate reductase molybdenum cofactor assembly chaperone [Saccharolobus shibatae]QXJ32218.1 hypothetical protein J5U21_01869 [Saccharolobus shibatae]QXJ35242.1 hypothetical protein J5U22_01789 [Saccharolobus shibatae]